MKTLRNVFFSIIILFFTYSIGFYNGEAKIPNTEKLETQSTYELLLDSAKTDGITSDWITSYKDCVNNDLKDFVSKNVNFTTRVTLSSEKDSIIEALGNDAKLLNFDNFGVGIIHKNELDSYAVILTETSYKKANELLKNEALRKENSDYVTWYKKAVKLAKERYGITEKHSDFVVVYAKFIDYGENKMCNEFKWFRNI